jgi:hypothetical protein
MMPGPASQPALPGMVPDLPDIGWREPPSAESGFLLGAKWEKTRGFLLELQSWLGRDKKRRKLIQKTECIIGNRQQVIEFSRGSRQQKCSLAGRITRGDLVELIVRQRDRTFSFRCSILCSIRFADGRLQRRRGHQTKNFTTHRTILHNKVLRISWNIFEFGFEFFFYNCGNESYL